MTTSKKFSKVTLAYVSPKADLRRDLNELARNRGTRGFVEMGNGCHKASMPMLDEQRA